MSKSIRVSVIVPTYNHREYIGQSIESVLQQTEQNHEVIVVNDGSTDDTESIVKTYMNRYPGKVRYLYKKNGGVASALNAGMNQATGEFLAWLSADDVFYRRKLEEQLQQLEMSPGAGLCYTDFHVIDGSGNVLSEVRSPSYPSRLESLRALIYKPYINGSTVIFRRECVDKVGDFDEDMNLTADTDMWRRILLHYDAKRVEEILVGYRWHRSNNSHNRARMLDCRRKFYEKALASLDPNLLFPGMDTHKAHLKLARLLASKGIFNLAEEYYRQALLPERSVQFRYQLWKHRYFDRPRHTLRAKLAQRLGWYRRKSRIEKLVERLIDMVWG
jgi:glycosyltransferase involved in cell wall biosynthesis